ncbi:unnamed protein product [Ceutorhynchus assimilis]|uniref:Spermatogenesis-associated protein 6 N-terminal domain-containing protein n=1 Tax=Ceutorhynchus assimilis TaxID=467358 RepID=A0A9N9MRQ2_9CUCU|nr:unnamed protein product [Ceutorhynchus assimilis]
MPAKSFLVKVELTVQKISCPGVWLCSNGKVSLQLCMLDSTIQTEARKPIFPVVFAEKFIFYKTFLKERRLNELQRSLGREWLCVELIQWKNCDEGMVLASFQTTLDDLLYPSSFAPSNVAGSNIDLLMVTTKLFPGTISPKLELCTKTTIEETFSDAKQRFTDKILQVNPMKSICSVQNPPKKLHPKKVCHTVAYSQAQQRFHRPKKDKRPIFKYQRPEDDLILRTNPDKVVKDDVIQVRPGLEFEGDENQDKNNPLCYCGESVGESSQDQVGSSFVKIVGKSRRGRNSHTVREQCPCSCGSQHSIYLCPTCSKYECTFTDLSLRPTTEFLAETKPALCSCCRKHYKPLKGAHCPCKEGSVSPTEKKVCFCFPEENGPSLAQRLHARVKHTIGASTVRLETCIRDCEVCE